MGLKVVAGALMLLGGASAASAQGLGAAAAREKQKRQQQTVPAPARVFTDADLSRAKPPEDEAVPADGAGEPKRTAGEPTAPEDAKAGKAGAGDPVLDALEKEREERKLQEAEWRVRFANAREQLAQAEAACWREVVRTEFYQGVPVQMKVKEFVESEELRQAQRALADLEEQYRRTGLPPGWAREP